MCHDDSSRPPAPPRQGAVGSRGELVLEAADGNRFAAYEAHPEASSGRGMVILPDVRGLHDYYRDLAVRFAEAGFDSVAFDYFGRTAGIGDRSEAFEYMPHVQQTTPAGIIADASAAAAHLRTTEGGSVGSIFSVGFCFGGRASLVQSAGLPGLSGAIGFYGGPPEDEFVESMRAPLLVLLAGADKNIRSEHYDGVLRRLSERGVEATRFVYDGAPHSFFDRTFADHAQACADAWERVLEFTDQYAAG